MTDLNEMWTELEKYQPYADKRGFGEAWKRMTTERTEKAARAATWDGEDALRDAARAAEAAVAYAVAWVSAAKLAQRAIENIREAIEQEEP